ncbi:cell division protein FtsA [Buchnera aphidicola]|uniref:cell division protein FtsA n=1 Tax=Buchnera aphidicola TaxID=9 RepID=UPI00094DB406|nr:cell division protein FtsA [Buchnera aphidicola]
MSISNNKNIIVGLEIGSKKIIVLIGNILKNQTVEIIGFSKNKSSGIENGHINNLELLISCIKKSIYEAEELAKYKIKSAYVSVSHKDIECLNEVGVVPIKKDEVTHEDIKNAIKTAQSVKIKNDRLITHIIPQEFSIDRQSNIKNPLGLSGIRMQANVHLITSCHSIEKNITKAVEKCGIKVKKIIFSGLASSEAVLNEEEKKLGVCLVDIGREIINLSIYTQGSLRHSAVIPYAGDIVTKDIAYAFSLSYYDAEFIKKKYGSVISDVRNIKNNIEVFKKNGEKIKNLQHNKLVEVIESRYFELLQLVNREILNFELISGVKEIKKKLLIGIALTGGASKVKSLSMYAKKIFQINVSLKKPNIPGIPEKFMQPEYSTIIGLLQYGKKNKKKVIPKKIGVIHHWIRQIYNWLKHEL